MRVAHLDTGTTWRGGQAQVLALLGGLARRGHESLLLAPPGPLLDRARTAGHAVRTWRCRGDLDLMSRRAARTAFTAFSPDVVHAHTAHAHIAAVSAGRAAGAPVVVSRRVLERVSRHPLSRWKYGLPVARYLCVSRAVVETMRRSGVPEDRLALVPSAVDVPRLEALRVRAERGELTGLRDAIGAAVGDAVIGTVAAMTAEKRSPVLIDAIHEVLGRHPRARLVWIGEGPERPAVDRRIRELGIDANVHLLGFRNDAHELMSQLDLFALASRHEGLGTAVLEAQALGVPVVTTDAGGVRDAVTDGRTGRVVADRALATAILEAIEDAAARERWRTGAIDSVRAFDVEIMVDRTVAEYVAVGGGTG